MSFKNGDFVVITHRRDDDSIWAEEMQEYIGRVGVYDGGRSSGSYHLIAFSDGKDWSFNDGEFKLVELSDDYPIVELLAWKKFENITAGTCFKIVRVPQDVDTYGNMEDLLGKVFRFNRISDNPLGVEIRRPDLYGVVLPKSCLEICEADQDLLNTEDSVRIENEDDDSDWISDDEWTPF